MSCKWIEVFKTGTHTAMSGATKTYTEADLDRIVTKYNEQSDHEAPLVIGHPQTDAPAYGWIKQLKRVGERMYAFVETISEKIDQAVEAGMFRKVSIALYGDDLLRHVGLLGATPPAVKGLAPVEFATDKEFEEFSGSIDVKDKESLFKMLADFLLNLFSETQREIPKKSTQQEDTMDPEKLKEMLDAQASAMTAKFAEMLTPVQTEIASIKASQAAMKIDTDKQIAEAKMTAAVQGFTNFCDGLIGEGKVLAADRDALIDEFSDLCRAESAMQFAEGEKSLTKKFMDRLSARPAVKPNAVAFATGERVKVTTQSGKNIGAEFAQLAEKVNEASIDIDAEITAYAEKHNITYAEAAEAYER